MRRLWVVGAVMIAGLGCGDDGGSKLDRLRSELEEQIKVECECYEDHDFESRAECIEANQIDDESLDCVQDAIKDDDGASEFLDCVLRAERAYTDCADDLTCDEAHDDSECVEDYNDATADCLDELSSSASRDVDSCFEEEE